jgi:hypothetical protein
MNIPAALRDALGGRVDPLAAALEAAGHLPPARGLNLNDRTLLTSDANGNLIELSQPAQAFVNGYTPPPAPAAPDFGTDLATPDQLRAQVAGIVSNLTTFIDAPSPTNAQVVAAVKLNARINRYLLRRAV